MNHGELLLLVVSVRLFLAVLRLIIIKIERRSLRRLLPFLETVILFLGNRLKVLVHQPLHLILKFFFLGLLLFRFFFDIRIPLTIYLLKFHPHLLLLLLMLRLLKLVEPRGLIHHLLVFAEVGVARVLLGLQLLC